MRKLMNLAAATAFGAATMAVPAFAQGGPTLTKVLDRGTLLCTGHNGSFQGFAEVDDQGNWTGLDIDLCKGLASGLFGTHEGNLEIVPISWAQRWPALQSGDVDVIIKASGWTMSRDTELNLNFSRPYLIGAFQVMSLKDLGAENVAGLDGGSICVAAGTSTEKVMAAFIESNQLEIELITFEKTEEVNSSYFAGRCDGVIEWGPALAATRLQADNPEDHVILPDVVALEAEGIVVPHGDDNWHDIQNWLLATLWFAEQEGVTQANVDGMKANPPTTAVGKMLGATPGYGSRLGLSDDWGYHVIKAIGNFGEVYERNLGSGSSYKLPRGINNLWTKGGVHYPMIID